MLFSKGKDDLQWMDDRALLVKLDEIIDTLGAFSMVCSHSGHYIRQHRFLSLVISINSVIPAVSKGVCLLYLTLLNYMC